jgi:polyphosphate kinase
MQTLAVCAVQPEAAIDSHDRPRGDWSSPESPGLIMAKMNSLCDADVIRAL